MRVRLRGLVPHAATADASHLRLVCFAPVCAQQIAPKRCSYH